MRIYKIILREKNGCEFTTSQEGYSLVAVLSAIARMFSTCEIVSIK